jgi:[protein-PII] uridylyltransferase
MQIKPRDLVEELRRMKRLSPEDPAQAWGQYSPTRDATEYVIAVHPERSAGLFHRITGALTSQGLSILTADVQTLPGSIAWDRFLVIDPDYEGPAPQSRIDQVCKTVVDAIKSIDTPRPNFRRVWKTQSTEAASAARTQPTQIRFDNSTSEQFTIITVFAYDRTGLLYDISKTLFDLKFDLQVAKVSTHLDQVVDVFYVTDALGNQVTEPTRLYTLRQTLLRAIESPATSTR